MRRIIDNYLLFDNPKEFNKKTLNYFYTRLCLFLAVSPAKSPLLAFDNTNTNDECDAYFDEDTNTIGFDQKRYDYRLDSFRYNKDSIIFNDIDSSSLKFVIPLSDIYHELIHKIQKDHDIYEYTDLVEATAEIYGYMLTGQWNIEYRKEALSLWYFLTNVLKVKKTNFYLFIRGLISKDKNILDALYTNAAFMREVAKVYNGHINAFWNEFKGQYYHAEFEAEFKKDLDYIHSLIFYNY